MKLTSRKGIRLGLVAGLVMTGLVGVTSLTASGQSPRQQVVGQLVLTVPGGSNRTGTVQYFTGTDGDPDGDGVADATQNISAASACDTITSRNDRLLKITSTPSGSRPVLQANGVGILTANQNCGTAGVIAESETMMLALDQFFTNPTLPTPSKVYVSKTDLKVFRPDGQGGELRVIADGGAPTPRNLANGLNEVLNLPGFKAGLGISSTSTRFNKGINLREARFTLVTDIPNVAPVASFDWDVDLTDPLKVNFTDMSTDTSPGSVVSRSWDFGDSSSIDDRPNPDHKYATPGTYTVTLTVADDEGAPDTYTDTVTVNVAPEASFTYGANLLEVKFTDTSTDTSPGNVTGWSWNFGDSSPASTERNPTHPYTEIGTYNVTLTVTDDGGLVSSTVTQQVEVKFKEAVFCGESVVADPGVIADGASFLRLNNKGSEGLGCEEVGVRVEIVTGGEPVGDGVTDYVFWDNEFTGVNGTEQLGVLGLVTIKWAPIDTADAGRLDRKIDYDGYGPGGAFDTLWCVSYNPATNTAVRPKYDPTPDDGFVDSVEAPWCLVSDNRELTSDGIVQTEVMFGGGDPAKW